MPQNQFHNEQHLTVRQQIFASLRKPLVQYLLMFLTVLCVYVPTFWFTYVWDDWDFIARNESLREWKRIPSYFTDPNTFSHDPDNSKLNAWRPVRNIYYLLTYKAHGLHPAGWHFHHVLLHCLVAAMLLAVFHRLYRFAISCPAKDHLPVGIAVSTWFAVLAWAVHPANLEVTAWLKSADDLLACLFSLCALAILFPIGKSLTFSRCIIAGLTYGVGLLAKESVAPIPAIYIILVGFMAPDRRRALRYPPYWAAAFMLFAVLAIYTVVRTMLLGKLEQSGYLAGNFSLMMATMVGALVRYFQLTFWPFWPTVQIPDYFSWQPATSWTQPDVLINLAILFVILVIIIFIGRRKPIFLAGWCFAALAFTPVANIIPMIQVMAERFMYFPLMGIALAVSFLYILWMQRNASLAKRVWLPAAVACALIITTLLRMPTWVDEQNFKAHNLEVQPDNYRANWIRANELNRKGKLAEALPLYEKSMRQRPNINAAMTINYLLVELKDYESANDYLDRTMRAFPKSTRPYPLKAYILGQEKKTTALLELYDRALQLSPDTGVIYYYKAGVQYELGNTTEALSLLDIALNLDPQLTSASVSRSQILEASNLGTSIPIPIGNLITHERPIKTHPFTED